MDGGAILRVIIINLMATVLIYLFVPVLLMIRKKKYALKQIKRITIINCIVCAVICVVLEAIIVGEAQPSAAMILWGSVGYGLLKKYCLKEVTFAQADSAVPEIKQTIMEEKQSPIPDHPEIKEVCLSDANTTYKTYGNYNVSGSEICIDTPKAIEEEKINNQEPTIPATNQSEESSVTNNPIQFVPVDAAEGKKKFCSDCGSLVDPNTKQCTGCGRQYFKGVPWKTVALIVMTALLVASCILNISLYKKATDLDILFSDLFNRFESLADENIELEKVISELMEENDNFREKAEFLDEYVVMVEDDGTDYYHKFDCDRFLGDYFWIYSYVAADGKGYQPCPECYWN